MYTLWSDNYSTIKEENNMKRLLNKPGVTVTLRDGLERVVDISNKALNMKDTKNHGDEFIPLAWFSPELFYVGTSKNYIDHFLDVMRVVDESGKTLFDRETNAVDLATLIEPGDRVTLQDGEYIVRSKTEQGNLYIAKENATKWIFSTIDPTPIFKIELCTSGQFYTVWEDKYCKLYTLREATHSGLPFRYEGCKTFYYCLSLAIEEAENNMLRASHTISPELRYKKLFEERHWQLQRPLESN